MKTLAQIRDAVLEAIHSYEITDDSVIDPELIEDKIVDLWNTLVAQEVLSGVANDVYYMPVENIECELYRPGLEVSGTTVYGKGVFWKASLPALHPRLDPKNIQYLGTADFENNYSRKTLSGFRSVQGNRHTATHPCYTIVGKEAWLKNLNHEGTNLISMIIIPDDPRTVTDFDIETTPFPVADPQKLEMLVIQHFVKNMGFPPDKITDANIGLQQQQQQQNG